MHNVDLINHTLQRTHAGSQDVSKTNGWSSCLSFDKDTLLQLTIFK